MLPDVLCASQTPVDDPVQLVLDISEYSLIQTHDPRV